MFSGHKFPITRFNEWYLCNSLRIAKYASMKFNPAFYRFLPASR